MPTFNVNYEEVLMLQRLRTLPIEQQQTLQAMIATLAIYLEPAVPLSDNVKLLRPAI